MSDYRGSIWKGIGIGALLTAAGVVLSAMLMTVMVGYFILIGIGLAQFAWIGPAYAHYRGKDESETAKGLLVAGGIVFLLNATCWGLLAAH